MQIGRIIVPAFALLAGMGAGPTAVKDSPPDLPNWPPPKPVPYLSAAEAIKTMKVEPGFRVEVVAEEPLVEHPVAMSFDADGRMWVVEMRGYMPDVEGNGEDKPTGRVSVLEDTDGDGKMDKVTVFMDNLVLPRAIACVRDGVLLAVPPKLMFCRDTDGDGKADEQTVIATDYGVGGNPEHQPNGLMPGLDNWIYSANYPRRLRWVNGSWVFENVLEVGQWGISQDDFGRLYHNNNTDQLRASIVPPHYATRNPHLRTTGGANERIAEDQTTWPLHDTAVDRGYMRNLMRDDGTILYFTAACAPVVYRGGLFPPPYSGNAFVCEPAGNMIKRNIVTEQPDGKLKATNAYEGKEFLASTYERFRPVNLNNGPDGSLYVVDMHHGLLQHKVFLTTYCKEQYLQRDLEKHLMTGRIYRIVPEIGKPFERPQLSKATTAQLVATLSHPNGWWRDTAQRLLVEQQDFRAVPMLRALAGDKTKSVVPRLHALWCLEGLGANGPTVLKPALADPEPKIRAAAVRLCERNLNSPNRATILPSVLALLRDKDAGVRLQLALTLSAVAAPETDAAVTELLARSGDQPYVRTAILTGIAGRELEFLQGVLASPAWKEASDNRSATLSALVGCVLEQGSPKRVGKLLDLTAGETATWRRTAMLDGMQSGAAAAAALGPNGKPKRGPKRQHRIMLEAEPKGMLALRRSAKDPALKESISEALGNVHWPGEPGYVAPPPPKPLTAEEQRRFERGAEVYAMTCAGCHKPDGRGQEGLAPPLVDSEWVVGPPGRILRIVTSGLQGPITVDGKTYSLEMPAVKALSDEDVAAVVTYVRRSWEHTAPPVEPKTVTELRATPRPIPWTERELYTIQK